MQCRCSSGKAIQLEEKVSRLEQERAELMITIQKGEGFDTAIQQLQQDNVSGALAFTPRYANTIVLFSHSLVCKMS